MVVAATSNNPVAVMSRSARAWGRRAFGFRRLLLIGWQSPAPVLRRRVGTNKSRLGNSNFRVSLSFSKQDEDQLYAGPFGDRWDDGFSDRIKIDGDIEINVVGGFRRANPGIFAGVGRSICCLMQTSSQ
jgi:hypothetical protein